MESFRETADLLAAAVGLVDVPRRMEAARDLARVAGAEDLILFIHDPAIGQSLPAPGFPQTLQGRRSWQALVDDAIKNRSAVGTVPGEQGPVAARAIALADGTAAVLLGGAPIESAVAFLSTLLPLFGALLRTETAARHAQVEATMARQAAAQASDLASRLDTARSDMQRALDIAEKATRSRDEFLATVSHELRTPLTSMIGWLQLLRGESNPIAIAEGLETIDRNARAQTRLIEDILDFSRINAGKLRLDVRPTDMVDVISAAIEVTRPAADAKGIRLHSVLDPDAAHVSADADRLQQIFWNLLSNAVKFTPRGGRVQVRLERINSHCELTVTDNGEGIAPEFLPHVFDRFSQADGSSTRSHGGLGLGLGIVRHLVELHGGTVQARSAGLGQGAAFAVRLPLLVAHRETDDDLRHASAGDSPDSVRLQAELAGVSVLVVEDNEDSRKLLIAILSRSGARVQAAESVAAAMRILAGERPDIVISDIEMPGEDGYSLIRKIRLQEPVSNHIPAIALTAYTRSVDRVRALEAGFQTHMSKPVEPAELVAAVKSLLAGQRKVHS